MIFLKRTEGGTSIKSFNSNNLYFYDVELIGKLRIFIRYFCALFRVICIFMILWKIIDFQLKESFAVEEEGYDEVEGEEAENLMRDFVEYVKSNKVR